MLTAQSLRKMTSKFKDPVTYGGMLTALEHHAENGFRNINFKYNPTKKNRELVEFAIKDLTKRGFRVFYNDDSLLSLEVEW